LIYPVTQTQASLSAAGEEHLRRDDTSKTIQKYTESRSVVVTARTDKFLLGILPATPGLVDEEMAKKPTADSQKSASRGFAKIRDKVLAPFSLPNENPNSENAVVIRERGHQNWGIAKSLTQKGTDHGEATQARQGVTHLNRAGSISIRTETGTEKGKPSGMAEEQLQVSKAPIWSQMRDKGDHKSKLPDQISPMPDQSPNPGKSSPIQVQEELQQPKIQASQVEGEPNKIRKLQDDAEVNWQARLSRLEHIVSQQRGKQHYDVDQVYQGLLSVRRAMQKDETLHQAALALLQQDMAAAQDKAQKDVRRMENEVNVMISELKTKAQEYKVKLARVQEERDQAIGERDQVVSKQDQVISERDRAISKRDQVVSERDQVISKRDQAVSERDQVVSERGQVISERDQAISERGQAISERGQAISERGQAISQRDQAISERGQVISERDQAISQRDQAISQRDQAISQRDQAISQRDQVMSQRDQVMSQRDQVISERDRNRKELDRVVQQLASQTSLDVYHFDDKYFQSQFAILRANVKDWANRAFSSGEFTSQRRLSRGACEILHSISANWELYPHSNKHRPTIVQAFVWTFLVAKIFGGKFWQPDSDAQPFGRLLEMYLQPQGICLHIVILCLKNSQGMQKLNANMWKSTTSGGRLVQGLPYR
jgi:uncharacterized protein (DUF3084 family)